MDNPCCERIDDEPITLSSLSSEEREMGSYRVRLSWTISGSFIRMNCKKGAYENVNRLKSIGRQFDILPVENSSVTTEASEKISVFRNKTAQVTGKSDPAGPHTREGKPAGAGGRIVVGCLLWLRPEQEDSPGASVGACAEGVQAGNLGPFEVTPASTGEEFKDLPPALADILHMLSFDIHPYSLDLMPVSSVLLSCMSSLKSWNLSKLVSCCNFQPAYMLAKPIRAAAESDRKEKVTPLPMVVTSRGWKICFGQIPREAKVALWMKGINLILNRNSDEELENVFWTWDMSTLSPCPVLGKAYTTVLLPCPGTCGPQDDARLSEYTAKQTEMNWSSPHPCPQRGCGCIGTTVLCDQEMATSGRTTANVG
ncbi:hypothetical protein llap_5651 [Limosa lapponica baueri]|uniref:Uncharacterized protein n=1 Tax=Limosa lapponica baueri TaxID=1758121 RepID=A0A2I0UDE6_LIMLA|nr:hypothetical protein llap_5651 [Limosa lapponica baueri]